MVGVHSCHIPGSSDLAIPTLQPLPHPHCSELPLRDLSLTHDVVTQYSKVGFWLAWGEVSALPCIGPDFSYV